MNCVFIHGSSTHEFGAMRSDCLVQFSILNPFFGPPWIAFSFMRPPPTSLEPCVVIAECNPPFTRVFHRQGRILLTGNVIFVMFPIVSFFQKVYMYIIFVVLVVVCIVLCRKEKKRSSRDESCHRLITERARRTKSMSYLCFPLIYDKR